MIKRHMAVIKKPDNTPDVNPMKEWLRQNPEYLPQGVDANESTSYQIRRALRKNKWELEELPDRVLLIKPDENGETTYADVLLGDGAEIEEDLEEEEIIEAEETTFGLERDMQMALRANIEQLELGLIIIDDGKERVTEAGRIDITASDKQGNIVIVELKAGTAQPKVITQVLAYMGAVAETDNKKVRGLLVAKDFHKQVVWAARAIPNLQLKKYSIRFTFEPAK
jgi:hypothetical protein